MEEGNAHVGMEDLLYYIKRAEEFKVDLDIGEIKQYFPVSLVISGMLKMFQDLFGKMLAPLFFIGMSMDIFFSNLFFFFHEALRFDEIKDAEVWHDTVRVFLFGMQVQVISWVIFFSMSLPGLFECMLVKL